LTFQCSGVPTVIHTYNYYIQNAIGNFTQRGAIPIVSSVTPDNIWQANGTMSLNGGRFQGYAQLAASRTGVAYVDHFSYVAQAFNKLGESTVNTYFPFEHTHTSPTGEHSKHSIVDLLSSKLLKALM
jgi:rhamnogalacturonan acetylesterase